MSVNDAAGLGSAEDRVNGAGVVSIVVPCCDEEANLLELHQRVGGALSRCGTAYEVVYVDDGSTDSTPLLLQDLQAADPQHVRVVFLSRNFGHQFAVTAGLAHAAGDAVVIIDADMQDPPEVICDMVQRWRDGYDVVYG
ncbi:MAG: glycosyltransferase family 2 protein, partial [Gemmatimonadota bacterium]|nr:glycosyltransferase family 2 protein [Gemmatimonadota bacterium]